MGKPPLTPRLSQKKSPRATANFAHLSYSVQCIYWSRVGVGGKGEKKKEYKQNTKKKKKRTRGGKKENQQQACKVDSKNK